MCTVRPSLCIFMRDDNAVWIPPNKMASAVGSVSTVAFDIPWFDFSKLLRRTPDGKIGRVLLFVGRRGSGKTTGMVTCAAMLATVAESCAVFCKTEKSYNRRWAEHVPEAAIYNIYDEAALRRIIKTQEESADSSPDGLARPTMLIFDDVAFGDVFKKSAAMQDIFFIGRHLNIIALVAIWDCTLLQRFMRGQTDQAFFFSETNQPELRHIYDNFGAIGGLTETEFIELFHGITCPDGAEGTEERYALTIDVALRSNKVEKVMSVFSPQPGLVFKIGTKKFWGEAQRKTAGDGPDAASQLAGTRQWRRAHIEVYRGACPAGAPAEESSEASKQPAGLLKPQAAAAAAADPPRARNVSQRGSTPRRPG
jgi:hypothetical protein